MPRPKVGLIGFFGWGNFGDELFLQVHKDHLSDVCDVEPINDLIVSPYFSQPIKKVVERYDGFVIGGGDLIVPWQLSSLYFKSEYLQKPIFIVGVGVPTWKGGSKKVVSAYREFFQSPSVKLIVARDAESADWIAKHLRPQVTVQTLLDLVCALDFPEASPEPQQTLGIVLRHRKGSQDNFSQVRVLCERARSMGYAVKHIVLGTGDVGRADLAVANDFRLQDEPVIHSEDLMELCKALGSCHAVASMKFHGSVVATMYGVPSITLSSTDKNRNFMRIVERTDLSSSYNAKDLPDRLPRFPAPISTIVRAHLRKEAGRSYKKLRRHIEGLNSRG